MRLSIVSGSSRGTAHQRQAVPVSRHERHLVRLQHQQRAIQVVARVLAGNRKLRLRDHVAQRFAGKRRVHRAGALREGRKIVARHGRHPRIEPLGRDLYPRLVLLDPDVGLRQRLHDLVELLCGQRQRPALGNRGLAPTSQSDFEIRCRKPYLAAPGIDQHVCEDGDRVLSLHDALEELQFTQQIGLADDKFHAGCALERDGDRQSVSRDETPRPNKISDLVFQTGSTNTQL